MRFPFVVFEGLSASGKSTVAQGVAKALGAALYKTPPIGFLPIRDWVDCIDSRVSFLYYLAGDLQASREIEKLLAQGPVVCDRYVGSTICSYKAKGVAVEPFLNPMKAWLRLPDFTFLVLCDQEARLRRLHARPGGLTPNDWRERNENFERAYLAAYRKLGLLEVDNSSSDPQQAVGNVLRVIEARWSGFASEEKLRRS